MTTSKGKTNMKNILIYLAMTLTLLTLAACGGGGGGNTAPAVQNPPPIAKTTATLTINQTGSLPGSTTISGADFTITLPANVTPTMTNGAVAAGVVTLSGTFADSTLSPQVVYTPATASAPGTLKVILASSAAAGLSQVGEMATITLQLANGAVPTASSFVLSGDSVIDAALYAPITGMNVVVASVTLQ
jgi:predicted small lipoprotein YifL